MCLRLLRLRVLVDTCNLSTLGPYFDFLAACAGFDHHSVNLMPEHHLGTLAPYLMDVEYR